MLSRFASSILERDEILQPRAPLRWLSRVVLRLSPSRITKAVRLELRLRRDERLLMTMSDHELSDLGIGRGQVPDAVRHGRRSSFSMDRF
jgi:uncharacterized protein YjiS (DUF1127 family)